MKDVTDLLIYRNALILLKPIYQLADLLPRNEFEQRSQLTNAAKSIAPLIAEGFAKRRSQIEFKRFLEMALGSCDEVVTHIRQIGLIGFPNIKQEACDALLNKYKILARQINKFIMVIINKQSDIRRPKSDV